MRESLQPRLSGLLASPLEDHGRGRFPPDLVSLLQRIERTFYLVR